MSKTQLAGMALGLAVGAVIWFLPNHIFAYVSQGSGAPTTLTLTAQRSLGVMAGTIVWWMFNVINSGAVVFLMIAFLLLAGNKPAIAASGFAGGSFWLLLSVLFYGHAMSKTRLAHRIAYWILGLFPPSYKTLLFSFALIGIVLALGIPSLTVRIAIMVPLAWAVVKAIKLPPGHSGSALITLGTWWMALMPGNAFLTGTLMGPIYKGMVHPAVVEEQITWGGWLATFGVPVLLVTLLMGLAIYYLLKPREPLALSQDFFKQERAKLGAWSRQEKLVLLIIGLSILGWVTKPWHGVDEGIVALVGFGLLFLSGVLQPPDLVSGVPWPLVLFMGGILTLMMVFLANDIHSWMGSYTSRLLEPFLGNIFWLVLAIVLLSFLVRFADPTTGVTVMVLTIPMWSLIMERGINFLVWGVPAILGTYVFLFPYQMFWFPMGLGLTEQQGWTPAQARKIALAYYPLCIIAILLGVLYWKALGLV